jgi:SM-20-related protein
MAETNGSKSTHSLILDEFLSYQELTALVEHAHTRRDEFRVSQVFDPGNDRPAYRRSRVLMDAGPFHSLLTQRILFYLPRILNSLRHAPFEVNRIESQITASGDGDYFRMHNDNTHANWPTREITFVYFFHAEPRPFSGGELVLYGPETESHSDSGPPVHRRVVPEQNSIIFFQSSTLHEILPVHCQTAEFKVSRFTMNGWLHS